MAENGVDGAGASGSFFYRKEVRLQSVKHNPSPEKNKTGEITVRRSRILYNNGVPDIRWIIDGAFVVTKG